MFYAIVVIVVCFVWNWSLLGDFELGSNCLKGRESALISHF
jgi:hypothetical protein